MFSILDTAFTGFMNQSSKEKSRNHPTFFVRSRREKHAEPRRSLVIFMSIGLSSSGILQDMASRLALGVRSVYVAYKAEGYGS